MLVRLATLQVSIFFYIILYHANNLLDDVWAQLDKVVRKTKRILDNEGKNAQKPNLNSLAVRNESDDEGETNDLGTSVKQRGSKIVTNIPRAKPASSTKFNIWNSSDRDAAEINHAQYQREKAGVKRSLLTSPGYDRNSRNKKKIK